VALSAGKMAFPNKNFAVFEKQVQQIVDCWNECHDLSSGNLT
jgi:hypothetical protein